MAVVVVLGLALVVYARQSEPGPAASATANEISYAAYGFYRCDGFLGNLTAPESEEPDNTRYRLTDGTPGVMEWRPAGLPRYRAKLGVFLDAYDITLNDDGLTFPKGQNGGESLKTSELKCKNAEGEEVDAEVQVIVWNNADNPGDSKKFITDFENVRIDKDGMAVTIAVAAPGVDIPIPASASQLRALAEANDQVTGTTTVAPGATTTTVPG